MFARTERLLLRPCWPEDAPALYRAIADEGIVRNLACAPWPYSSAEAERFAAVEHPQMFPSFMLMRRTDAAPQLIGACGLGDRNGEVELGYWIARAHWGQGYATEAAKAVVDVAKALGHPKLVAGHFTDNPASGRVLRKLGFRPLGSVERRFSAGRRADASSALFELTLSKSDKDGSDDDAAYAMRRMRTSVPLRVAA